MNFNFKIPPLYTAFVNRSLGQGLALLCERALHAAMHACTLELWGSCWRVSSRIRHATAGSCSSSQSLSLSLQSE
jgi:hypothetical protein